jgi:hypothetical protein
MVVLSALFILSVSFYRYSAIRDEFYASSYVYGLVVPYNQYGNESFLPSRCDTARGMEDPTLLRGYVRLSIGSPPIREQSGGDIDLSAGLVPRGSGSSPIQEQDGDGIVWDTPIGDAASVKAEVLRQVANLHVDTSGNSGFKTAWCWYRASTFRQLYPDYQHTSDNGLVRTFYRKAGLYGLLTFDQSFHQWTMLFQTVAIAIGIPVGILALGYACFWALAGFKSAL